MIIPIKLKYEKKVKFVHTKSKKIKKQRVMFAYTTLDDETYIGIYIGKNWLDCFKSIIYGEEKDFQKVTGNIGLDGMKYCYKQLVKLDKKLSRKKKTHYLILDPSDNRRFKIYKRFSKELGFIEYEEGTTLYKRYGEL